MWGIKIISGSQKGQVYQLKKDKNIVGRNVSCDIQVSHPGVSRKHFQISLKDSVVVLADLNSVNGTFVNGVLIEKSILLNAGDKISCNNMIFEFNRMDYLKSRPMLSSENQFHNNNIPNDTPSSFSETPSGNDIHGNLAFQTQSEPIALSTPTPTGMPVQENATIDKSLTTTLQNYFETVVMPGVYQLAQWAEFRWVLGSFILVYVILITLLSILPLVQISKERILKESQLRALDISKSLAQNYRAAVNQGLSSTFIVEEERLEGVETAMVIAASDGHILAPARKLGNHVDLPFIHRARKQNTLVIEELKNNTIGVSVPIRTISPEGESHVTAFSMLIYNVSLLKFEDVIRLFVQVLAFALLIGFILFILFYRLIEYPIRQLNMQIDQALKKGGDSEIEVNFNYPEIQRLITNIKSALSRITKTEDFNSSAPQISLEEEAQGLIHLIKTAGLILDTEGTVIAINSECDSLIGEHSTLLNKNISDIGDQALQLNLQDLFQRAISEQGQTVTNELEFSGINYTIEGFSVLGTNTPKFVIITFSGQDAGGDF